MEVTVRDYQGKELGRTITLSEDVFGIEPNEHAVYLDVKQYLSNQRQGTHKAKERNEITGSTRKIKKQKGTGTARAGSIKSPIFKGGGRIFGPRPRNYGIKVNKNVKRLARRSVLSLKAKENAIIIVEDFSFDTIKTKRFKEVLASLGIQDKKSLFVLGESNNNVYLSSRNLKQTKVLNHSELNTYSLLNAQNIVLLESSLKGIETNLGKTSS